MKRLVLALAAVVVLLGLAVSALLWTYSGARVGTTPAPAPASVNHWTTADEGWTDCRLALALLELDRKLDLDSATAYADQGNDTMATYYRDWAQRWFLAYNYAQWKCGGKEGTQPVAATRIIGWFGYAGQIHLVSALAPASTERDRMWHLRWGIAYMHLQEIFAAFPET